MKNTNKKLMEEFAAATVLTSNHEGLIELARAILEGVDTEKVEVKKMAGKKLDAPTGGVWPTTKDAHAYVHAILPTLRGAKKFDLDATELVQQIRNQFEIRIENLDSNIGKEINRVLGTL